MCCWNRAQHPPPPCRTSGAKQKVFSPVSNQAISATSGVTGMFQRWLLLRCEEVWRDRWETADGCQSEPSCVCGELRGANCCRSWCCGPICPCGRGLNGGVPDNGSGFVCTAAHVLFCVLLVSTNNQRRWFPPSAGAAAQLWDYQFVPHLFRYVIHECSPLGWKGQKTQTVTVSPSTVPRSPQFYAFDICLCPQGLLMLRKMHSAIKQRAQILMSRPQAIQDLSSIDKMWLYEWITVDKHKWTSKDCLEKKIAIKRKFIKSLHKSPQTQANDQNPALQAH